MGSNLEGLRCLKAGGGFGVGDGKEEKRLILMFWFCV